MFLLVDLLQIYSLYLPQIPIKWQMTVLQKTAEQVSGIRKPTGLIFTSQESLLLGLTSWIKLILNEESLFLHLDEMAIILRKASVRGECQFTYS
jgi:hypothetical protein